MLRRAKSEALDLPPKYADLAAGRGGRESASGNRRPARSRSTSPSRAQRPGLDAIPGTADAGAPGPGCRQGAAHARGDPGEARDGREGRRVLLVHGADRETEGRAGDAAGVITGSTTQKKRASAEQAFQKDENVRVLLGNLHAAGVGINLTAAHTASSTTSTGCPGTTGSRGPHLSDRPAQAGFVTYLVAERTLDDFVAALLEQKARTIGVLEDEAADHATLLDQVIESALRGETPRAPAPRRQPGEDSVGLLGDVLDLLPAQVVAWVRSSPTSV
jgi:hypothetical protein